MKVTSTAIEATQATTASATAVFDALADLTRIPDWWLWSSPHPRIKRPVFDVRQVDANGTLAAHGVAVDVKEFGGSIRVLGRRIKEGPTTYRFATEIADRPHRLRLGFVSDNTDIGGWSAFDFAIAERQGGSTVTLRMESEVVGVGPRAGLMRFLTANSHQIPELRLAYVIALAGDTSALDPDRRDAWLERAPALVDGQPRLD